MPDPQFRNVGAFLPTTQVFDSSILYSLDVNSKEFKDLIVKLFQVQNNTALNQNIKISGFLPLTEFVNGRQMFPDPSADLRGPQTPRERPVFQKMVNFGALPNTGTKSVAHGVDFTNTYSLVPGTGATATDPIGLNYLAIPNASPTLANNIEITIDATNVNITTGSDRTSFTLCYVQLEYIKY